MNYFKFLTIWLIFAFILPMQAVADELSRFTPSFTETIKLSDFVDKGVSNDTEFEEILIDQLTLQYRKRIGLPAPDLILSVKEQYHLFIEADKGRGETDISLSKLFPFSGTTVEASYESDPISAVRRNETTVGVEVTQSIAENAFGRSTRWLDQIIGLEVDIAEYQIAEAYEDYLAFVMRAYFEWFESYKNLEIGISSYRENLKLLTNIKERQKSNVALPIDVNKVEIQVSDKKEALYEFYDSYLRQVNTVAKILMESDLKNLGPEVFEYSMADGLFDEFYEVFSSQSRTHRLLDLLAEKSSLQTLRDADDLLPSVDLFVGYEVEGTDFGLQDNDRLFYAGVQFDWPIPETVERAEYEVSRINERRTALTVQNTKRSLRTRLKNLFLEIEREEELLKIAERRINLARDVLEDETENYTFGKVTLNDYIQAVNALDNARFNHILHDVRLKKLILEWRRLSDSLIEKRPF